MTKATNDNSTTRSPARPAAIEGNVVAFPKRTKGGSGPHPDHKIFRDLAVAFGVEKAFDEPVAQRHGEQPAATGRHPEAPSIEVEISHDVVLRRMREIATQSGDSLYLADGCEHPDWRLLELCANALQCLQEVDETLRASRSNQFVGSQDAVRQNFQRRRAYDKQSRAVLLKAKKIKSTTGAGIYAKALLVQNSRTAAPMLAASLAADLIACEGLRASLWPNKGGI